MWADDLIARVLDAHAVLGRESDLSPCNPRINTALTALVQGVLQGCPPGEAVRVLADPRVGAVRDALVWRLGLAETAMERHWSRAFGQRTPLPAADLTQFLYWDCYRHLVEAELDRLAPHLRLAGADSIAFVGAGPLPLSAILVQQRTGLRVTCIDVDPEACRLAAALLCKAGLAGLEVVCARGAGHDYRRHPVVLIASLVRDKAQVVTRVRETRPTAVVALRSAEGLCTLLYDPVDEAGLAALGCGYLGRTAANPYAINTTLLYTAVPACRPAPDPGREARQPQPLLPAAQ